MTTSLSAFVLYLGVANYELPEHFQNVFDVTIAENLDQTDYQSLVFSREAFDSLTLSIYSNIYPSFSPEPGKKHVIVVTVPMPFKEEKMREEWNIDDLDHREEEYRELKYNMAERALATVERHLPGLRKKIEVMEIATPVTMKRYTRNKNGAFMGWDNTPEQSNMKRLSQKTPIKNLFLGSAWSQPCGGVPGAAMSGSAAAECAIKVLRRN